MNPNTPEAQAALSNEVTSSWKRFIDVYEPFRTDLYRYCRNLTRSPWDADDLVQDTMARAFVTLGSMHHGPPANPRAWLFRVASNLWIDRTRHARELAAPPPERSTSSEPRVTREAAGTLLSRLSPQERAAVVLKDAFELSLQEIAEVLSTTVGAVKAALHGGRGKLMQDDAVERARPAPELATLNAFCDAFNAADVERLASLLLDNASVEVVRASTDYGPEQARRGALEGMLFGSARMSGVDDRGGMDPQYRFGVLPERPRVEVRIHRGEPLLIHWYRHRDGEFVRAITRVEAEGDRIARLRNYFFTPDVIEDVCRELDVPYRSNGYSWC